MSCDPEDYGPTCRHSDLPNGTACGGGNVCVNGACTENLCADCADDGSSCTIDCDFRTGECEHIERPDGTVCSGGAGECVSGACCGFPECDDQNDCTANCKSTTGACQNVPLEDGAWAHEDCVCVAAECAPPCEFPGAADECPNRDCLIGNCLPNPDPDQTDGYCEYVPVDNGQPCGELGACIDGVCTE